MDAIDHKILACLKANARENATDIGEKINLSTSAVIERIRKLEASGLIQQYTTIIDQKLLGRDLIAFIFVGLEHPKYYEKFVETINAHGAVAECYYIAGDFDFLLKIVTSTRVTLEETLTHYEKGVKLAAELKKELAAAEEKLTILGEKDAEEA